MQQYPPKMNAISLIHNTNKASLGCTKQGNDMNKVQKVIQIITQIRIFPRASNVNTSRLQVPHKMRDI